MGLDDLAVADLAAPALDLVLFEQRARHHVALDVLEVEAEAAALRAPEVGGLLEEAVRVVLGDEDDPGHRRRDLVERDRAVDVALGALGLPDDPLVRNLLDDRGLPGPVGQEDLRPPVQLLVGLLLDALDLLGEARVVGELRPLVVGDAAGNADVELFDDVGDLLLVALAVGAAVLASADGGDGVLHLLLRAGRARAEARLERRLSFGELLDAGRGHLRAGASVRGLGEPLGHALDLLAGARERFHHERLDEFPPRFLELVDGQFVGEGPAVAPGVLLRHGHHFACSTMSNWP